MRGPELGEEADEARYLQVYREMARELEMISKALKDVIDEGNRSLLSAAATCIFSNVRLTAPTVNLHALVAAVPTEYPKGLALEVKEHIDTLVEASTAMLTVTKGPSKVAVAAVLSMGWMHPLICNTNMWPHGGI